MPMTPWDSDSLTLSLFIGTGLVANGSAESVLLVGPPGSGKSELIRRFGGEPSVQLVSDVTVEGLRELVSAERTAPLRHIAMPEFGRMFSHRADTVANVTGLLTSLMTRDAGLELVGPRKHREGRPDLTGVQVGVVGAMTSKQFAAMYDILDGTGFLSRFTVLKIERTAAESKRVTANIFHSRRSDLTPFRCHLPELPVVIEGSHDFGSEVGEWLEEIKPNADPRYVGRIISLLRSIALLSGGRRVTPHHVALLKMFTPYLKIMSVDGGSSMAVPTPLPTFREFMTNGKRKRRR